MSTSSIPCRYWVSQGRCFFGSDCKYLHATAASNHSSARSLPAAATAHSSSSAAAISSASVPASRASNRASFRPLAILSDDGQPLVQPSAAAEQPATASPAADTEQPYQPDDIEQQPTVIYSGGDYHSPPLPSAELPESVDHSTAEYDAAVAELDPALLDASAAPSMYDTTTASSSSDAAVLPGPASGLPSYPTQPSGHVSLPARSLTSTLLNSAQSQSPHFLFADSSGLAVQSQPQRSFFMNETLRERLLFHQQLAADRLQPEGQRTRGNQHTAPQRCAASSSPVADRVLCCAAPLSRPAVLLAACECGSRALSLSSAAAF